MIRYRRFALFTAGLYVLWIALASPLASLDHRFLTAHMVQHLLLMTIAAPLLLSAAVLPRHIRIHPVLCWFAATAVVIVWHLPHMFDLALHSRTWHALEQASFLIGGLLFWLPVLQPRATSAILWTVPVYLFLATMPCDALGAFLTFSNHVVYPHYASTVGVSAALEDQGRAGALMWVWVTIAYLAPAVSITVRMLSPQGYRISESASASPHSAAPAGYRASHN